MLLVLLLINLIITIKADAKSKSDIIGIQSKATTESAVSIELDEDELIEAYSVDDELENDSMLTAPIIGLNEKISGEIT